MAEAKRDELRDVLVTQYTPGPWAVRRWAPNIIEDWKVRYVPHADYLTLETERDALRNQLVDEASQAAAFRVKVANVVEHLDRYLCPLDGERDRRASGAVIKRAIEMLEADS